MDCTYSKKKQAKSFKRAASARSCTVGLFMLISTVFSSVASRTYYSVLGKNEETVSRAVGDFFASVFGISRIEGAVIAKNVLYSGISDELFSMLSMLACLFLPAYFAGRIWKKSVSDCFVTDGKLVKGLVFIYAFSQLVMFSMTSISDGIFGFLFPGNESFSGTQTAIPITNDIFTIIISFLCTCIMVPIIEEYVFRGVVYRIFEDIGTSFAVVASALCFGLMHSSPSQCMYAIAFGLFSAVFVAVTGNIKTSILFHMINNTVSSMTLLLSEFLPEKSAVMIDIIYILYVFSFSFYGMYLFFSKNGILYKFREKCLEIDGKREFQAGLLHFLSVPVLIFILLFSLTAALGTVL